jgi:hypothetical protein
MQHSKRFWNLNDVPLTTWVYATFKMFLKLDVPLTIRVYATFKMFLKLEWRPFNNTGLFNIQNVFET